MDAFTLSARETSLLGEIVDACAAARAPLPARSLLEQLEDLLAADEVCLLHDGDGARWPWWARQVELRAGRDVAGVDDTGRLAWLRLGDDRPAYLLARRVHAAGFGDRVRFHLLLLRPHLEQAWGVTPGVGRGPPVTLTARQLEVLELVRSGLTNLQIAHRLRLSEGTVRTHLNHVYAELGVASRTAAVHRVFEDGR